MANLNCGVTGMESYCKERVSRKAKDLKRLGEARLHLRPKVELRENNSTSV